MKLLFIIFLLFSSLNAEHIKKEIGIFSDLDSGNAKHMELILKIIQELLNKNSEKLNFDLSFDINLYHDKDEIYNKYLKKDLLALVISPYYYLKEREVLDKNKEFLWAVETNSQEREQYYLIANKKIKNPMKNISKYQVSILGGSNAGGDWIRSEIYKKYKKPFNQAVPNFKKVTKESKVVYDVFFNKNNLGIISKAGYELLSELNPQIKKHTKIVRKSKEIFLSMIAVTNMRVKQNLRDDFRSIVKNINDYVKESELAASSNVTHVHILQDSDIKELIEFYDEFYVLEKKYEK